MTRCGGKRRLLKHILPIIEATPHACYCEVFSGGAAVLIAKTPSRCEVLNDIDGDLVNFYLQAKYHPDALAAELEFIPASRTLFNLFKSDAGITELQRAGRYFYRNFSSMFGIGKYYAVQKTQGTPKLSFKLASIAPLASRLNGVSIECLDWRRCLELYDSPATLFYLDPPYTAGECGQYALFSMDDIRAVQSSLSRIKGKWLLSINDTAEIRDIFSTCQIHGIETSANMLKARSPGSTFKELLIHPYGMTLSAP